MKKQIAKVYDKAVIATGHPMASQAAVVLLKMGGNAFDAALGAGFMSTVVEPALTSLGGGGFLLARTREGEEVLFDFFSDTPGKGACSTDLEPHFFPVTVHFPGSDQVFNIGHGAVAVPGNLKGFLFAHARLGRLPLETIIEPAKRAARDGVKVNFRQAYFLNLLKPIMTMSDTGKKLFFVGSRYIREGDTLRNPHLAEFLSRLPIDRGDRFYQGEFAAGIAADMEQNQGLLTRNDLAEFRVIERTPLQIQYRGERLLTNTPPSFGGGLIALSLEILEKSLTKSQWGKVQHLAALAGAMKEVDTMRKNGMSTGAKRDENWFQDAVLRVRGVSRGTTHISVADQEGNVASMTTSNGEGSGYIVPGTGIMLNNMMGEDDLHPDGFHSSPAGERIASMMSPTMLVRNDHVHLALGSGGSKRIRTAINQVILNIIDYGLPIKEAVELPRIHWDGETLQVEPGFDHDVIAALSKQFPVNVWREHDMYFGGVQAVIPGLEGAGDPRRGGDAVVLAL